MLEILSSESSQLFMGYFKESLQQMFEPLVRQAPEGVPEDFVRSYLTGSFADTVQWWIGEGLAHTPEQVADYYCAMVLRK